METIVAISTPAGNSGVAVIRISGDDAKNILNKITKSNQDFEPRKMYLKKVYIEDYSDNCLVVFFRAPFSYTGEDVVEIQSHGGYFLAQKIIKECVKLGANLAGAGEFSKRAFINGKISIDQAEGIMDLINAETDTQARISSHLMNGQLKTRISDYQSLLTDVLADIEAKLDYPEYDFEADQIDITKNKLQTLVGDLEQLINDSNNGLLIKNGVKVAIVGAPNVGKSSLLNALTNSDKAIVTNIAGTTRDIVEAEYEYKGIIFRLYDTAGIHESNDIVESIGIERAKKAIEEADIVIRVRDESNICEITTDKPSIDIFNKSDLTTQRLNDYLYVSATTQENLDKLKQLIFDKTLHGDIDSGKLYLTNLRHIECVKSAINSLNQAIDMLDSMTMDIISFELKNAWLKLGEISGVNSDENILDAVFSKFCLGK